MSIFSQHSLFSTVPNVHDASIGSAHVSSSYSTPSSATPHFTHVTPIKKSTSLTTLTHDSLAWASHFGSRNSTVHVEHLKRGHPDYVDVSGISSKGVQMVTTIEQAEIVVANLMKHGKLSESGDPIYHACDTEVMAIDLKKVGPVGNGYVTCLSMYSGPDFDYGLGGGKGLALFVDNLDESEGVMNVFKPFFESEEHKKVWHNYGFDRHVMFNEGIDCLGFGGDTMHMARLQDSGRAKWSQGGGYSLEALTEDLLGRRKKPMKEIFGVAKLKKDGTPGAIIELPAVEDMQRKREHRAKWIAYSAYDAEGTWLIREELEKRLRRMDWLKGRNLYEFYAMYLVPFGELLTDMERRGIRVDAKDYLNKIEKQAREDKIRHSKIFREWAASLIGPDGLAMNPNSAAQICTFLFGGAANTKTGEPTEDVRVFKTLREEMCQEALDGYAERDEFEKNGPYPEDDGEQEEVVVEDEFTLMTAVQLKALLKEQGLKQSGKKEVLQQRLRDHFLGGGDSSSSGNGNGNGLSDMTIAELRDTCIARGLKKSGKKKELVSRLEEDEKYALELMDSVNNADKDEGGGNTYTSITEALNAALSKIKEGEDSSLKAVLDEIKNKSTLSKWIDVKISSIYMRPEKFTVGGVPSVTADVLRGLAGENPLGTGETGDKPIYGKAYEFFGGGQAGHDACVALYSLTQMGSIDTMIGNFLLPLQFLADEDSRVHCSLNLNTETGRLSARRPNLQNQPALEKDQYKIRAAFQASEGNSLIVCDYGQLELRLLASMTSCESMISAFREGGDFHSRTAMGMFDYVKKSVDDGEVYFEWDYSKGEPDKPMLKDKFGSERRKAKTLNFSIAYGKTAHGLSKDWGVSVEEAQKMLEAWYADRPEVLQWQKETIETAKREGITRTLMGRYRNLPDAMGQNRMAIGHASRAAINTPIQGGAADVAMAAMIKINKSEKLKELGWIMLLQVHDEVILEGPKINEKEALAEVKQLMQNPWGFGLEGSKVDLLVDGDSAQTWYEAK